MVYLLVIILPLEHNIFEDHISRSTKSIQVLLGISGQARAPEPVAGMPRLPRSFLFPGLPTTTTTPTMMLR